jgi:hypothetical protein
MPLDPRVKRFLAILAAGNPPNALDTTVEQRRQGARRSHEIGRRPSEPWIAPRTA